MTPCGAADRHTTGWAERNRVTKYGAVAGIGGLGLRIVVRDGADRPGRGSQQVDQVQRVAPAAATASLWSVGRCGGWSGINASRPFNPDIARQDASEHAVRSNAIVLRPQSRSGGKELCAADYCVAARAAWRQADDRG
jgi:hypothetical protein